MNVSVETTGNLSRRLKFTVPSGEVEKLVTERLQRMSRRVRLDGFRPGKVPFKVIQERYGKSVFHEVASEVIESSYQQAVADHGLAPAGQPDLKDTSVLPGRDIQFTADIELYPDFEPAPLNKVRIEKSVAEVRDGDVDDMVERLRLRHAEWRPVQRPVREGDRVRVHFEEKVEEFNTDENDDLVLDISTAPGVAGDFGRQLLKAGCGDGKKIKIKFPKDYPRADLAKKKIKFRVEVREIKESVLPALEQSFFEQCGVKEGGLKALKEMLKEGMEYELKSKLKIDFKNKVMDVLSEKNDIDTPKVIVQREIERMRDEAVEHLGIKEEDTGKLVNELFRKRAVRHVKLGLIMNKIARRNQFEVNPREFEAKLEEAVVAYEDADAAREYYRHNQQAQSRLAMLVIEDKVFQWVLDQVQVEEKPCSFKDIMNPEQA